MVKNSIPAMKCFVIQKLAFRSLLVALIPSFLVSCSSYATAPLAERFRLVQLTAIELDSDHPERKEFGRLTLLSALSYAPRTRGLAGCRD